MRSIQSYQSFSSSVSESWNSEPSHFEQACINEGVSLKYSPLNEADQEVIDDITSTVENIAGAMTAIQAATEKGLTAALKAAGAKAGAAGKVLVDDPNIVKNSKIYIATLEKLLAEAKKNPAAYMSPDAKKSLASLLGMSVGAGTALKKVAKAEGSDVTKTIGDAFKWLGKAVRTGFEGVKGAMR